MPKERGFNPVQAQRKAEKAKTIKKGKAEQAARRNEKLARHNPDRIQKQIDDLKAITEGGGKLSKQEEKVLEDLETELKAVRKAREALGDKAPTFSSSQCDGGRRDGVLGKRRRGGDEGGSSSDEDVPEEVKNIPMPRDTPPPIPKEVLDKWFAKRRARRNANTEPLGEGRGGGKGATYKEGEQGEQAADRKRDKSSTPATYEARTVYEAAPLVRDLKKEAVSAFMPAVVRAKMDKGKGQGGLIEPEEADQLEEEGYMKQAPQASSSGPNRSQNPATDLEPGAGPRAVMLEDIEDEER